MDHYTFNAYAFAVRHAFGPDAGIAAIIDTYGPGTEARAPFVGADMPPAGSAVVIVAADVGDPVHVVDVYGYRRRASSRVTYARVGGGTQHPDMPSGVRAMADAAMAADLDYVTGF